MKELEEFLRLVEEGKKVSEENDTGGKFLKELSSRIKGSNPFDFNTELPILESVDIEESVAIEEEQNTHTIEQDPVQMYTDYFKNKSFQQPEVETIPSSNPEIKVLTDKLKFLEQWVGKISAAGPGSGEVNFRYLDDVNRSTMSASNDNWLLEYDSTTKKVQFTEDTGPVRTAKFNTSGKIIDSSPGMLSWNPDEDCLNVFQSDGTTLQVGLEQYIRVHNHLATTLTNGTVVKFAGVENTNNIAMPVCDLYVADGQSTPLLLIGVLTTDIVPGGIGRATTFGYVRDLNTTGSDVGETWQQGDLLWGHPTIPGKLTRVRPTAPNVATSIAAVVRVGTTDGQLLVRPTIFPRLFFGDWYSTQNQVPAVINTPYRITLNQAGTVSGFTNNNGLITAQNTGLYNFQFSLQVTSANSSNIYYWIWYRKNGQDVANSTTKLSISSNSVILAPAWNFPVSLQAGETFELMWAADKTDVTLSALPATSFCPAIPSVILTVQQVNL